MGISTNPNNNIANTQNTTLRLTDRQNRNKALIVTEMLSSLIKEHQAKQQAQRKTREELRKEALSAAGNLTDALVDHLNVGVAQAYLNEKKLDTEARQLQNNAANFSRQAQQWLQLVESFSSALKEVGDVDNWARSIEKDLKVAETALEYAYKVGPNNS